jgi:hypothetical protein
MYLLAVAQEDDFFERHDAETCEDFKNEADFVEIEALRNIISHKEAEIERLQSIIKEIVRD